MDILSEGDGVETFAVETPMTELINIPEPPSVAFPEGAVRNRAATSALLQGDPNRVIDSYQLIQAEAAQGVTTTHDNILNTIAQHNKNGAIGGVMQILGDRNIPLAQKEKVMNLVRNGDFKEEPATTLRANFLAAPSKGEDIRGESARIKTADALAELQAEGERRQKLFNHVLASQPSPGIRTIGELAEADVLPFGNNYMTAKIAKQFAKNLGEPTSLFQWIKDFATPETAANKIREKLNNVPPESRDRYSRALVDAIQKSATVFPSENYFAQYQKSMELLLSPQTSKGEEWTRNMLSVFDLFAVGDLVKGARGVNRATTAMDASSHLPQGMQVETAAAQGKARPYTAEQSKQLDQIIQRNERPAPPQSDVPNRISKLQEEKAALLGDVNLAGKGDVASLRKELDALNSSKPDVNIDALTKQIQATRKMTFQQARKEAEKQVSDITTEHSAKVNRVSSLIERNQQSAITSQKLDAIDSQIKALEKQGVASPGKLNPIADSLKRIELNSVVRQEHPVSPFNVIEQVNPAQARAIHNIILNSTDDEVAKAFTGMGREQALINNTFPQVATDSGTVLYKANMELGETFSNSGALRFTDNEVQAASDTVVRDFRSASGLQVNDAMSTFRLDGDHMVIDAHYSTPGGAWTTPEAARAQAELALRQYGVKGDEILVMERKGMDYVPASSTGEGDYIIKVQTRIPLSDDAVATWDNLDVKRNFFDRISWTGSDNHGSLTGMLFDPSSILHPTLTKAASTAVDQSITLEKALLQPIRELRDMVAKMPRQRRVALEEYMLEANVNGLKHDPLVLKGRGFDDNEIEALRKWRNIWDGHYYLENYDLVRTLKSQGYQLLDNGTDRFFAKPVAKNQNIGRAYDPSTGTVVNLDKQAMDDLYAKGGTYASLRRPATIQGYQVEHIIVRNTPSEYLRGLRETDAVLNYREGYYTVNYKAPKFIDEVTVDSAGKETYRTVGVAGNTKDAQMFAESRSQTTGVKHRVREDNRGFRKDGDGYWDLQSSGGRIAQRLRGKPLEDAVGVNQLGTGAHIESPLESAVRSARSLAGRTVTRPMLETAKRRFVNQYAELLKPTQFGERMFPASRDEIVDPISHTSSRVADARATYQYIKYLEDGYINSADEVFKAGMNIMADMLGSKGMSTAERAVRLAGEVSPTHAAKSLVFRSYIAMSNPIRQWIVQAHQSVRTVAYNPTGWATGNVPTLAARYLRQAAGLGTDAKGIAFSKFVDETGMVAGVDKNSLVRGMQMDMADASFGVKRLGKQAWDLPQKIGFDPGEQVNQIMHLAAVYDKYERKGLNLLDKTIRDQAASEARALSYDLNKAGELAYTQGSAAAALQFLQMPHKAMLQLTNRRLPLDVKLRMFGMDMIMFGVPTGAIGALLTAAGQDGDEILPDNEDLRDIYVSGLESHLINRMLTQLDDSGEKTRLDLSALSPYELDGWARMMSAMTEKGYLGMLAASPAGQILAVDGVNNSARNGRIPQAILTFGRFWNVFDEIDPSNPTTLDAVVNDVAKITSFWSAASNAKLMLETRKKYDTMGRTVDSTVTMPEIAGAFLGFGTRSTKELYELTQHRITDKKAHEEDVMTRYRDIMRYYHESLDKENPTSVAHVQKVTSMLMRTFADDPVAMEMVRKQWARDMVGPEKALFKTMMDAAMLPNATRLIDDIKMMPISQAEKDQMIERVKDIRRQREFNKQGN